MLNFTKDISYHRTPGPFKLAMTGSAVCSKNFNGNLQPAAVLIHLLSSVINRNSMGA